VQIQSDDALDLVTADRRVPDRLHIRFQSHDFFIAPFASVLRRHLRQMYGQRKMNWDGRGRFHGKISFSTNMLWQKAGTVRDGAGWLGTGGERQSSLVDWSVYPRLRGTMEGSEWARNASRRSAPGKRPNAARRSSRLSNVTPHRLGWQGLGGDLHGNGG
jgi:hypothetical protein